MASAALVIMFMLKEERKKDSTRNVYPIFHAGSIPRSPPSRPTPCRNSLHLICHNYVIWTPV